LLRRRVDALLIVPAAPDHRYLEDAGFGQRAVFLDRPPAGTEADTVLIDNAAGARQAVAHLLAHGHRRIAFVGDSRRLYTARERLQGYRRALADAGVEHDPELVALDNSTSQAATTAVGRLLALPRTRRPTAVFGGNNRCTVGALHALGRRRRSVGLVGFDDFELADLLEVSVVRTDPYRLGQLGAGLAFARLDGDSRRAQRVVVAVELVPRGSGEI
jgi:LacI family transcriptional regulator, galactose operon repressor